MVFIAIGQISMPFNAPGCSHTVSNNPDTILTLIIESYKEDCLPTARTADWSFFRSRKGDNSRRLGRTLEELEDCYRSNDRKIASKAFSDGRPIIFDPTDFDLSFGCIFVVFCRRRRKVHFGRCN